MLRHCFRPREIFTGTARDLADYLENVDISTPDSLTIHRVGVVHPLDESRVISCSKGAFFQRVRETQEQRKEPGTPIDLRPTEDRV